LETAAIWLLRPKPNRERFNYASAGTGSGTHMNAEKFRISAGIDAQHVPYKVHPSIDRPMAGRVDYFFAR